MSKNRTAISSNDDMNPTESLESTIFEKLAEIHSQIDFSCNADNDSETIVKSRQAEMLQALKTHIEGRNSLMEMRDSAPNRCTIAIKEIIAQIDTLAVDERATLILVLAERGEPLLELIFRALEASLVIHMNSCISESYMYLFGLEIDRRTRKPKAESLELASKIAELRKRDKSFGEIAKHLNATIRPEKLLTEGAVRQAYNRLMKEQQSSESK